MIDEQGMTEEEELALREQVNNEVWGDEEPGADNGSDTNERSGDGQGDGQQQQQEISDPLAGIDPALRETLLGLQARIGDLDSINSRLKQAENRIGGAERRLHESTLAAQSQRVEAPSEEQVKRASDNAKAWDSLKEDFPEWANAMDSVRVDLAKKTAEIEGRIPNVTAIRESMQTDFDQQINGLQKSFEIRLVDRAHKDWRTVVQGDDYRNWITSQPENVRQKAQSDSADDAIDILDSFKEYRETKKTPQQIAKERQKRLETAAVGNRQSNKTTKPTSFDDLSPEEQRKRIFEEVYRE